MTGVHWRHARAGDGPLLEAFACAKPNVRQGQRRVPPEPWATEVQSYLRAKALGETAARRAEHDQRLILVFDDDSLVAVVAHQDAGYEEAPTRILIAGAVALARRGGTLSDGRSAFHAALVCLLEDVQQASISGPVLALGWVHPGNRRCLRAMARLGWAAVPTDDGLLEVRGRLL